METLTRMPRTALLAGATGLVGGQLLRLLSSAPDYDRIVAIGRRAPVETDQSVRRKLTTVISDFSDLPERGDQIAADDVFCCLGSTLAAAGSRTEFERIDHHLVVALAQAARAAGARRLLVVSAAGSSATSLSFYSRVKARMEQAVSGLGYDSVEILRPSLLLGERAESRPAERAAQRVAPLLAPLLPGPLRRYQAVSAEAVAAAMLELARRGQAGVHIRHLPVEPTS